MFREGPNLDLLLVKRPTGGAIYTMAARDFGQLETGDTLSPKPVTLGQKTGENGKKYQAKTQENTGYSPEATDTEVAQ